MGRRSDHSRAELEELILAAGHTLLAETGYAGFSAREVAKRVGYSVGTLYNVFESHDDLMLAINTRTFVEWAAWISARLERAGEDRIAVLVDSYFDFATANRNLWMAIYDHRLPEGAAFPDRYAQDRRTLTLIVEQEIARVLPPERAHEAGPLTRSLLATVHGHCVFALNGTFALLEERHPRDAALARVREALAAA
ncbi:AcrR family transcriptional regulator [Sphingomonas naasensis]|uniref:TetR/AcrR family transcriptional regulator n=1 Tax=Sphingomonas naasensis TaxID=1344951 RepID=A0A4S1WME4_9SPHN|nr:TetR/AcrR family transcriptional regulator [Sphingomonas naasensis]NIJ20328.1 AcrR family transcriptional regulator [Sphingomonas naasensis]TGX44449.1 TetR/AcrR family transcriptional regulator [Sphingomonas naasensis]